MSAHLTNFSFGRSGLVGQIQISTFQFKHIKSIIQMPLQMFEEQIISSAKSSNSDLL